MLSGEKHLKIAIIIIITVFLYCQQDYFHTTRSSYGLRPGVYNYTLNKPTPNSKEFHAFHEMATNTTCVIQSLCVQSSSLLLLVLI